MIKYRLIFSIKIQTFKIRFNVKLFAHEIARTLNIMLFRRPVGIYTRNERLKFVFLRLQKKKKKIFLYENFKILQKKIVKFHEIK